MKLTFENLGPIRRAELNLDRSLTVIAGENNTGKTWLANMVLAANQALQLASSAGAKVADNRTLAQQILEDLRARGRAQVTREVLWQDWDLRFADVAVWLKQNAPNILATSALSELQVAVEPPKFDQNGSLPEVLGQSSCSLGHITARYLRDSGLTVELRPGPEVAQYAVEDDGLAVNHLLQDIAFFSLYGITTSFPAERLAFSALSHRLAANWSRAENLLLRRPDPEDLPLLLALGLSEWFRTLDFARHVAPRNTTKVHAGWADKIEALLGGQVVVDDLGNPSFKVGTQTLSLAASSSIVKSLAPLVLWLRYRSSYFGLVIIDEPEICLHPGLQRKLAQIFGMMVNQGWRLMLSTHSDYIADELSLLVRLGAAGEKGKKIANELGVPAEALITPDRVRAYEFGEGELKEAKVDENGFILRVLEDPFERRFDDIQLMMTRLEEPDNR